MGKPVFITLTVQANALYAIDYPTGPQVDNCSTLSDDNNGSSGNGVIDNFQSNVYANNTVTWSGVTADPNGVDRGYNIAITQISNNSSFFPGNPLTGTPGRSGNVSATANGNIAGQNDTYTIYFTIYPPGNGTPKSAGLTIDPKLQGNN